jgi:D-alanyl-D-alanine carboxypeptidase (penicillin-binding protein 5/6)
MKKFIAVCLTAMLLTMPSMAVVTGAPDVEADAVLLMERETGTVLYEENAHDVLEPASVTKIMTLLLVMEALDRGQLTMDTMVTVSAHAAGMGGSQVYLKEGEQMSVHDMLKAVTVASGNDAAVALGEAVAGSESAFVAQMNQRAKELGMAETTFQNCTGLPTEGHVTSAYDIGVMSRALLSHEEIRAYTSIWMDSLRDGAFQLSNTNKLIRFYEGATGLKTGYTATAGHCISASAQRDGMELIAVVLHAPSSSARFETAKSLLNFGFANYTMTDVAPDQALAPVDVVLGACEEIQPVFEESARLLLEKAEVSGLTQTLEVCKEVEAPVEARQKLGTLSIYRADGSLLKELSVVAPEAVPRLTVGNLFGRMLQILLMKAQ